MDDIKTLGLPEAKTLHLRANIKSYKVAKAIKANQEKNGMYCHILCLQASRYEVLWHKADEECKYCLEEDVD